MKAKKLNNHTWILVGGNSNCGLVSLVDNKYKLLKKNSKFYSTIENLVENEFPSVKFEGEEEKQNLNQNNAEVGGFEVKHFSAIDIKEETIKNQKISVYKTDEKSTVFFVAGYFGVAFKGGMSTVYCPKKQTLLDNDFIGPFASEFDAKFHINNWRRENAQ